MEITENKIYHTLSLDVVTNNIQVIYAQQGDKKSRFIKVVITADDEPITFKSGMSATLKGHRADGQMIFDDCKIIDNYILVELKDYILAVPGECEFNIGLYGKDNSLLSTIAFKVFVSKNPYDEDVIIASPVFSALIEALNKVNKALEDTKDAINRINDKIDEVNDLENAIEDKMDEFEAAENERKKAEQQREQKVNDAINDMRNAANEAINDINEAKDNANDAADRANAAADRIEDIIAEGVGTGIYVSETLPEEITNDEHWFKILGDLDSSLFEKPVDLDPKNIRLLNLDEAVSLSWTDPVTSEWLGTLITKTSTNTRTGETWTDLLDVKTKNQYSSTPYIDNNVTNGIEYSYGIWPYSEMERNEKTIVSITPSEILPSPVTNISCAEDVHSLTPTFSKDSTISRVVLVYKKGSIPTSATDVTVINNFNSGTAINNLVYKQKYGLRFFTYNEKNRCNKDMSMSLFATPSTSTITLNVPESYEIKQGQTINLGWTVSPTEEAVNVTATSTSAGLTFSSDFKKVTARSNAAIGNFTITIRVGDVSKVVPVVISLGEYTGLVKNINIINMDESVKCTFTRPSDCVDVTIVYNSDHKPRNESDGNHIIISTNSYANIDNLINNTRYYFAFFPKNSSSVYNYNDFQIVEFTPTEIIPNEVSNLKVKSNFDEAFVTFNKDNTISNVKLVYKLGSAPTSQTDGVVVENYTSNTSITLPSDGTYYFRLFTFNEKRRCNSSNNMIISAIIISSFTITYVLNGGINSSNNPTIVKHSDNITLSPATKEGHTFAGWYTENNFVNQITSLYNISNNLVLYAKFIIPPSQYKFNDIMSTISGGVVVKTTDDKCYGYGLSFKQALEDNFNDWNYLTDYAIRLGKIDTSNYIDVWKLGVSPCGETWVTLMIDKSGNIWGRGHNVSRILNSSDYLANVFDWTQITSGIKFVKVTSCGTFAGEEPYNSDCTLLALDDNGNIWLRGWDFWSPNVSNINLTKMTSGKKYIDIATSYAYSLMIDSDNNLYHIGDLNTQIANESFDTITPLMIGRKFCRVFTHSWESAAAITTTGELFVWGRNNDGMFGNNSTTDVSSSSPIKYNITGKVIDVVLGACFMLVLTEEGDVYETGNRIYVDDFVGTQLLIPTKVNTNIKFKRIVGTDSSVYALGIDGYIYQWGSWQVMLGEYGTYTEDLKLPEKVNFAIEP